MHVPIGPLKLSKKSEDTTGGKLGVQNESPCLKKNESKPFYMSAVLDGEQNLHGDYNLRSNNDFWICYDSHGDF